MKKIITFIQLDISRFFLCFKWTFTYLLFSFVRSSFFFMFHISDSFVVVGHIILLECIHIYFFNWHSVSEEWTVLKSNRNVHSKSQYSAHRVHMFKDQYQFRVQSSATLRLLFCFMQVFHVPFVEYFISEVKLSMNLRIIPCLLEHIYYYLKYTLVKPMFETFIWMATEVF